MNFTAYYRRCFDIKTVIAGRSIWPQVTSLRQKVKSLGLNNLRVEKLDLLQPYDVDYALKWDIEIQWEVVAEAPSTYREKKSAMHRRVASERTEAIPDPDTDH